MISLVLGAKVSGKCFGQNRYFNRRLSGWQQAKYKLASYSTCTDVKRCSQVI